MLGFFSAMLCVLACLASWLAPVRVVIRLFGVAIATVAIAAVALAPAHELGGLLAAALVLAALSILFQCVVAIPGVAKALDDRGNAKLGVIRERMAARRARK